MTDHRPHTHLGLTPRTWRKWHRWIGFPAALFLLFAAVTGFLLRMKPRVARSGLRRGFW
jgi:uncharacterized iron-regulated membrane protein